MARPNLSVTTQDYYGNSSFSGLTQAENAIQPQTVYYISTGQ